MKVAWHLGLGDAIACAAIVAKFAFDNKNEKIQVPCWERNFVSVKSFFINYPNIEIVILKEGEEGIWQLEADLRLGHYNHNYPQLPTEDFVQWFYRQANFDMNEKDKWCPIEKAAHKGRMYISMKDIVYHDDEERGFNIKNKKRNSLTLYRGSGDFSILTYHNLLLNAKEIHCIDSSFLHLVESLPTTGKLFYHKYARPDSPDYKYLKKEWQILN